MTQNKMFPLNVSDGDVSSALTVKGSTKADLWHLRYGHLNVKGLQLLGQKNMIVGLSKIEAVEFCEGCVYGKKSRPSFPVANA